MRHWGRCTTKQRRGVICIKGQFYTKELTNATEATQRLNNGIFGRDNVGEYFALAINRKYL